MKKKDYEFEITLDEWLQKINNATNYDDLYDEIVYSFARQLKINESFHVSAKIAGDNGYLDPEVIITAAALKLKELKPEIDEVRLVGLSPMEK